MTEVHPQFVVDDNENRKAVVLSIDEWRRIVEELEELDDIRAYDEAKEGSQDSVALEQALQELDRDSE